MARGNKNTLKVYTSEEAHFYGSMGGKASADARRRKKSLKELTQALLEMKPHEIIAAKSKQLFPEINPEDLTNGMVLAMAMFDKAIKDQDVKAAQFVRDTAGEMPEQVISGNLGQSTVFVTEQDQNNIIKHIQEVLNDGQSKTEKTSKPQKGTKK
jgi:hypothetical protein